MNPADSKFLLDLFATTVLAFGFFMTFSTITIVCAPFYFVIQFIFRSTFFVRHFGAQWKQGTLLAICMAVVGIIYGINHVRQTIESEARSEHIHTKPLLGKLKQSPRAETTFQEILQRAASEDNRRSVTR